MRRLRTNRIARAVTVPVRLALPRRRAWRRLLRRSTLDPDRLPRPVAAPGPDDFVICGCPRSGTTLMAAALFQPPRLVTVSEPWDGLRLPPAELFASLRDEVDRGLLRRGRLDVDRLRREGRVEWTREEEGAYQVSTTDDYLLGVKWPAFWRYLPLLPDTKFVVCVRHPAEVVRSFRQQGGRLIGGLEYDVAFHRRMNDELRSATRDRALRRVLLYQYVNERILPHLDRPNVFLVRYERWFDDREGLLDDLSRFLGVDVAEVPVEIRPPMSTEPDVGKRELEYLRQHCPTAQALGYQLDEHETRPPTPARDR